MNRLVKLFVLIIISLSVYFVYQKTINTTYTITSIGDKLSLGINSYGIEEYSYIEYYKEYLQKETKNVIVNKDYSNRKQTIKATLAEIKQTPTAKRVLSDTDTLILTLGYNDLLEELSLIENITDNKLQSAIKEIEKDYKALLTEIKKYYHEEIIVIGYYESNLDEYYINKGIKQLNKVLNNEEVIYIDTYNSLKDRNKYFSNPNSYYPNHYGYMRISDEIIGKNLAKR